MSDQTASNMDARATGDNAGLLAPSLAALPGPSVKRLDLSAKAETSNQRDEDEFLRERMAAIRAHLDMEVVFIAEFVEGKRVYRNVDTVSNQPSIQVGDSDELENTYCQRVVDGRLPEIITDTFDHPGAMALEITSNLPIRSHISVPIRLHDGTTYGTFCCYSSVPNHTLNERDVRMMRLFAEWAATDIGHKRAQEHAHQEVRRRIQSVLDHESLTVVYQPIYDIAAKKIAGFEALSRFLIEPKRTPDVWFSEASVVNLGVELEIMAIKKQLAGLPALPPDVYMSFNASPETLISGELEKILEGVACDRLVLELTEHKVIEDYTNVERLLAPLRKRGLRIAVDDVGSGYANFRHILKLAPDVIKLDTSLIRDIDTDYAERVFASSIIRFADETGCQIVAEGVETHAEFDTLEQLGVTKIQGYLLGRPVPLENAVSLCRSGTATASSELF
jgi:EAL domain-containing protein (putative c-di-GMP-specific phosphodiesterase class I)